MYMHPSHVLSSYVVCDVMDRLTNKVFEVPGPCARPISKAHTHRLFAPLFSHFYSPWSNFPLHPPSRLNYLDLIHYHSVICHKHTTHTRPKLSDSVRQVLPKAEQNKVGTKEYSFGPRPAGYVVIKRRKVESCTTTILFTFFCVSSLQTPLFRYTTLEQ